MKTLLVTLLVLAVSFAQPVTDGTPRLSGAGYITTDCARLRLGEEAPFPNYWVDMVNNYLHPNLRLLQAQRDLPNSHRKTFNFPTIGCVEATFNVLPNIPAGYAQGIFAAARSYNAFIRFSGYDQETQNLPDAKGMAIKLSGVTGVKLLPGFTDDTHVDFLFNAHPTLKENNETVLAATVLARTQLNGGGDRGRAALGNFYPQVVARDALERANSAVSSALNIAYYSVSAYKLGLAPIPAPAAKYRVLPCAGAEAPGFNVAGAAPDYLSVDLATKLAAQGYCFLFQVQLQTDVCLQPINDLSVEWLEAASPFVTVATVNISSQVVANDVNLTCRHTAFNPWRTTLEHRPLGSANRARLFAYMNAQNQRLSLNQAVEPSTQKVYPGWQTWANTEIGINDQFQTPIVKTGFPYNPQAGNFHAPWVPPTPCPTPRLCF
jgi:hypothetical protein